jgi:hypothetical protein
MIPVTTYTDNNGRSLDIDDTTVDDLIALSHITRESTAALAKQAVEQLRNTLVPSTRTVVARAVRKQKGATA